MIRNTRRLFRKKQGKHPYLLNNDQISKPQTAVSENLDQNIYKLSEVYDACSDVVFRRCQLFGKTKAAIIYIEGLSDVEGIEDYVLAPLMQEAEAESQTIHELLELKLPVSKMKKIYKLADCIESISSGNPVLLYDGGSHAWSLGLAKWEKRGIEEPIAEGGIRGSREGFSETLEVNTSQLRRIIKSPALKIQHMKVGRFTKTTVAVSYIEGIADKGLITEITKRLERIDIDGILESGYIEELIEDNPYSPFPQLLSTERPDIACSSLLEGRAVILVEGSPFILVAPTSLISLLQSQEDYYQRFMMGNLIRWLRYTFSALSLLLPSLYVAILTFHHEAVPTALLLSIASSREAVPFPAIVEALLMEIIFEALREAGVRLPKQVGSAVSIVGALVIGQASVQAGLVSAPMVIVVAITGISSFMMPRYNAGIAIRMLRFPMIFLAGTLGLLGIMLGIIAIVIHLCSLRSFGEPYLTPLAPFKAEELKDALWIAPLWKMDTRPHLTGDSNTYRQSENQEPNQGKGRPST